jgi:hypothetical protein
MPHVFKPGDYDRMMRAQKEVADLLKSMNADRPIEAVLVAFALARLIRNLLAFYPATKRLALARLVAAFIDEREVVLEGDSKEASRIITLH